MGDDGGAGVITAAWNITKDVATLMQNSQQVHMGGRAFALPADKHPGDLDWAGQADQTVQWVLTWSSRAADWGLSSGTSLRVGATWSYGGQLDGSGRFLHDAYLWAILDHSGLGQDFDVTGQFGDAVLESRTGVLSGSITVHQSVLTMHMETIQFDVKLRGDGGGRIKRM
jgi:hypothetical protein